MIVDSRQPGIIRHASHAILWDEASDDHCWHSDVDITLRDGRIMQIGPGGTLAVATDEFELDGRGSLVFPGLINLHAHPTTEPAYRGLREDHGVLEHGASGLYERVQAFHLSTIGRRAAQTAAYAEMLAGGITTVVDLTVPYDGWVDVMRASGLRVYGAPFFASARWVMRPPRNVAWEWDVSRGRAQFDVARALIDALERDPTGRLRGVVYPAQIDTCGEELLRDAVALSENRSLPLTTHLGQSTVEYGEMTRRHGITATQWAASIGLLTPRTIIAHAVFLNHHSKTMGEATDIELLAANRVTVAHCPSPFARYGIALETIDRYRRAGVKVGFGTDVAPHNLIEEMRLAGILARLRGDSLDASGAGVLFRMATTDAAAALCRPDIGRIAPGAKADLVFADVNHPLMRPMRDPLRSLIFHAADRAIHTVLVDGRVVYQGGRALDPTLDDALDILSEEQNKMCFDAARNDYLARSDESIAPLSIRRFSSRS